MRYSATLTRYWTVSTLALAAIEAAGLPYRVIRHGPVPSLAEAARARGRVADGKAATA
jgi:hypothetical protein